MPCLGTVVAIGGEGWQCDAVVAETWAFIHGLLVVASSISHSPSPCPCPCPSPIFTITLILTHSHSHSHSYRHRHRHRHRLAGAGGGGVGFPRAVVQWCTRVAPRERQEPGARDPQPRAQSPAPSAQRTSTSKLHAPSFVIISSSRDIPSAIPIRRRSCAPIPIPGRSVSSPQSSTRSVRRPSHRSSPPPAHQRPEARGPWPPSPSITKLIQSQTNTREKTKHEPTKSMKAYLIDA